MIVPRGEQVHVGDSPLAEHGPHHLWVKGPFCGLNNIPLGQGIHQDIEAVRDMTGSERNHVFGTPPRYCLWPPLPRGRGDIDMWVSFTLLPEAHGEVS